ncbi:MAG TPA: hypothetical protein VGF55_15980 [Gemmataceae bacterium]|jgi:hypothetical protein
MKPYYTIDAGEFLVGSLIEREFPNVSLWFPAKDEGDDLLLLDRDARRVCTVQIKVSRDYLATHMDAFFHPHLECCGWFTPNRSKIKRSVSDFWLIGLHSYGHHRLSVLVIPPPGTPSALRLDPWTGGEVPELLLDYQGRSRV